MIDESTSGRGGINRELDKVSDEECCQTQAKREHREGSKFCLESWRHLWIGEGNLKQKKMIFMRGRDIQGNPVRPRIESVGYNYTEEGALQ